MFCTFWAIYLSVANLFSRPLHVRALCIRCHDTHIILVIEIQLKPTPYFFVSMLQKRWQNIALSLLISVRFLGTIFKSCCDYSKFWKLRGRESFNYINPLMYCMWHKITGKAENNDKVQQLKPSSGYKPQKDLLPLMVCTCFELF